MAITSGSAGNDTGLRTPSGTNGADVIFGNGRALTRHFYVIRP